MTNEVEIKSFLWNYVPKAHDKIWGFVKFGDNVYCFWGRRGTDTQALKSIQFKRAEDLPSIQNVARQKIKKGYKEQSLTKNGNDYPALDQLYPGFVNHLRTQLLVARLSGTIRKDGANVRSNVD